MKHRIESPNLKHSLLFPQTPSATLRKLRPKIYCVRSKIYRSYVFWATPTPKRLIARVFQFKLLRNREIQEKTVDLGIQEIDIHSLLWTWNHRFYGIEDTTTAVRVWQWVHALT